MIEWEIIRHVDTSGHTVFVVVAVDHVSGHAVHKVASMLYVAFHAACQPVWPDKNRQMSVKVA